MTKIAEKARIALDAAQLVRISRQDIAAGKFAYGFPVALSSSLIVIQVLSPKIDLDGYSAFRFGDVSTLDHEFPERAFYERALTLESLTPKTPPPLDLSSIKSLFTSIEESFPLVTIHRELEAPEECEIGRVKLTSEATYALRWMSPSATWEYDATKYKYSEVTRVDFGDEYALTLAAVAGEPLEDTWR